MLSHGLGALPFFLALRRNQMPKVVDFACLSPIIYYHWGMVSELLGSHDGEFFPALLEVPHEDFLWSMLLLASLPWLLRAGDSLVRRPRQHLERGPGKRQRIAPSRRTAFYLLMMTISIAVALASARVALGSEALWTARAELGATFGPYIIFLYLPLYILGFYVSLADAHTRAGIAMIAFLVLANFVATIGIAQRTLLLLPIIIVFLFRSSLNLRRLATVAAAGALAAILMLPFFKWQYADTDMDLVELGSHAASADFNRSAVLAKTIELSRYVGTGVLSYPMEGYLYAITYYVPRSLLPSKGYSTAVYFTSAVVHTPPSTTDWGFGVGMLEEAALNIGLLFALPFVLAIGAVFGLLDRVSRRVQGVVPSTRLVGLFCCGYNLTAEMLLLGSMVLVGLVLHRWFVEKAVRAPTRRAGLA